MWLFIQHVCSYLPIASIMEVKKSGILGARKEPIFWLLVLVLFLVTYIQSVLLFLSLLVTVCHRLGTSRGLLQTWKWAFVFHTGWGFLGSVSNCHILKKDCAHRVSLIYTILLVRFLGVVSFVPFCASLLIPSEPGDLSCLVLLSCGALLEASEGHVHAARCFHPGCMDQRDTPQKEGSWRGLV
jgi:hypothetical protein